MHTLEHNITDSGEPRMNVDFKHGITCYFDIDDITISIRGSTWSGREIVKVDETIVSKKRGLSRCTPHLFEHADISYKLLFETTSILKGEYQVELYRNGKLVDSDKCQSLPDSCVTESGRIDILQYTKKLVPYFLMGAIAGAIASFTVIKFLG